MLDNSAVTAKADDMIDDDTLNVNVCMFDVVSEMDVTVDDATAKSEVSAIVVAPPALAMMLQLTGWL